MPFSPFVAQFVAHRGKKTTKTPFFSGLENKGVKKKMVGVRGTHTFFLITS